MARATRMPGQRDIARVTGVSQSTVSFVLNGRAAEKGIPEATQQRILEVADSVGYVPNVAARSLRGGLNGLIGVHTFERVFPVKADDYYHEFLVGIEEEAVALGHDLVLFASTQAHDGTRSIYSAGRNRLRLADGAVMLGMEQNDAELVRLAEEGYPFVFIGRRDVEGSPVPYVAADYAGAVRDTVDLLVEHGHRDIFYLGVPRPRGPQQDRRDGFRRHAAARSLAPRHASLRLPNQLTAEWLVSTVASGATAVVVETFELATALYALGAAAHVRIPDDLSMVCLDVGPRSDLEVPWSRIGVPRRQLGRRAVSLLVERLQGRTTSAREVLPCEPPGTETVVPPRSSRASDAGVGTPLVAPATP